MAAKNPRVHTVLEPPVYRAVSLLARREGVSLSQKVRDLVLDALETIEDAGLESLAEERRKSFDSRRALSADDLRTKLKLR